MKKSTRSPTGMVVIDALLVAGAAWMVRPVHSNVQNAEDAALLLTQGSDGAIGIKTALGLVAFWRTCVGELSYFCVGQTDLRVPL